MNIIVEIVTIVFWFLVILIPLVVIHEFGHLVMARLNKVRVLEFGVGIPPRWIYRRWKGIIWSLNFILLGGFARIYGDHDALDEAKEMSKTDTVKAREEYLTARVGELLANKDIEFFLQENNLEYTSDWKEFEKNNGVAPTEDKTKSYLLQTKQLETLSGWEFDTKLDTQEAFVNKPWWQQALILLGGVTFNLITAVVLFFVLYSIVGVSNQPILIEQINKLQPDATITLKSDYPKIAGVVKDYPADKAGLQSGDELVNFAGVDTKSIQNFDQFRDLVQNNKNQTIPVTYRNSSSGEIKNIQISLTEKDGKTLFGISGLGYVVDYKAKNVLSAGKLAVQDTYDYFILNFQVLGKVVVALLPSTQDRSALNYVSGPIAVSSASSQIFQNYGIAGIIQVLALVSIGLAAFNLLPLPALDGGRLVIVTLNKIFKRRYKRLEAIAISVTFILLLGLGAVIALRDISNIPH